MSASPGASPALDHADLATANCDSAIVQTPSPFTTAHDADTGSASATIKEAAAGQDSVGSASATITAAVVQTEQGGVAASQAAQIALALVSEQDDDVNDEDSDIFDPTTSREHAALAHIVATSEARQSPPPVHSNTVTGAAAAPAVEADDTPSRQPTLTAAQLSAHISLLHHLHQAFSTLTHAATTPLSPALIAALEDRYFAWLALLTTSSATATATPAAQAPAPTSIPPPDVLAVWYAHLVADVTRFADDLGALFGHEARDALLARTGMFPECAVPLNKDQEAWTQFSGLPWEVSEKHQVAVACVACATMTVVNVDAYTATGATCSGCQTPLSAAATAAHVAEGHVPRAQAPMCRFAIDLAHVIPMVGAQIAAVVAQLDDKQTSRYSVEEAAEVSLVLRRLLQAAASACGDEPLAVDTDVLVAYWTGVVADPQGYLDYSLDRFGKIVVLNQEAVTLSAVAHEVSRRASMDEVIVVAPETVKHEQQEDDSERTIDSVAADLDKLEQQVAALSMPTTPRKSPANVSSAAGATAASPGGSKGPSVASLRAMFESTKRAQRTVTVNVPGALADDHVSIADLVSGEALDGHLDLLESFAQHLSLARHQDKHAEGKVDTLYLVKAERRYYSWLVMLAAHPEAADVMPPVDVLLLWYNHMIHTPTYVADLEAIFGQASVPSMLKTPFPLRKFLVQALTKHLDTASQHAWEKYTGVPYVLLHNADVVEHAWLLQCPTCCSYAPIEAREFVALRMGTKAVECAVCWRTVTKTQLLLMRDPQVYTAFAMFSVDLVRTVQEWRKHVLRVVGAVELKDEEHKQAAVRKYADLAWKRAVVLVDAQCKEQVYHLEPRDWAAADVLLAYLTHTLWPNAYVRASQEYYGSVADHHTTALVMQNDNVNFHHWDTVRGRPLTLRKSAPVAEAAFVSESNIEDVVVEDGKNLMEEARIESNPLLAAVAAGKIANMCGVTGIVKSVTVSQASVRRYARYLVGVAQGHVEQSAVPPVDVAVVMAAHAAHPAQFVADATAVAAHGQASGVEAVLAAADQIVLRAAANAAAGESTWSQVESAVLETTTVAFPLDLTEAARVYRQQLAVLETVPTKDAQDAYARYMDMSVVIADEAGKKHMYSVATREDAVVAGHLVHSASPLAYAEWFKGKFGEDVAALAAGAAQVVVPAEPKAEPEVVVEEVQERALVLEEAEVQESNASVTLKAAAAAVETTVAASAYGIAPAEIASFHSLRDYLIQHAILYADPTYVAAAVRRYSKYLHAVAAGGDALVTPPMDVAVVALAHMSADPAAFQLDARSLGVSADQLAAIAHPTTRAWTGAVDKAAWGTLAGVGFELAPPALLSPPMPTCAKCATTQSIDSAQFALGTARCLSCKSKLAEQWPEFSVDLLRATMDLAKFLSNVPATWTAQQVDAEYSRFVGMSSLIVSSTEGASVVPEVYSIAPLTDAAKLGQIVHASAPATYQGFFAERYGVQVADTLKAEPVAEQVDYLYIDLTAATSTDVDEQSQESKPEPEVAYQYVSHVREMVHFADLVQGNSAHLLCQYAEFVCVAAKGPMQHMTASVALAAFAHHLLVDSYADDILALMGSGHEDLSAPLFVTQALNHSLNNGFAAGASPIPTTVLPPALYRLRMALPELLDIIRAAADNHMAFPEASYADVKDKMVAVMAMDGSKRMYSAQFSPAHALAHLQHVATGHWYKSHCQDTLGHVGTLFNLPEIAVDEPGSPTVIVAINDGYAESNAATPRAASASFVSTRSLPLSPVVSAGRLDLVVSESQVRAYVAKVDELEVRTGAQFTMSEVAEYVQGLRSSPAKAAVKHARIALVHSSLPAKYAADLAAVEAGDAVDTLQLACALNTQLLVIQQIMNNEQDLVAEGAAEYARVMGDAVMVTKDDGSTEFFSLAKPSIAGQVAHLAHMHDAEAFKIYSLSRFGTLVSLLPTKPDVDASQDSTARLVVNIGRAHQDESAATDEVVTHGGLQAAKNSPVTFEAVSQFAHELAPITSLTWSMHWVALYVRYLVDAEDPTYEQAPIAPGTVKLVALLHMSLGAEYRRDVQDIVGGAERFTHATAALSSGIRESNWDWHDVDMPVDEHEAHAVALNDRLAARFVQLQQAVAAGAGKLTMDSNVAYQRSLDDMVMVESQDGVKSLYSLTPMSDDAKLMHWFHVSQFAEFEEYMIVHFGQVLPLIAVPATVAVAIAAVDIEEDQVQVVSREIELNVIHEQVVKVEEEEPTKDAASALALVAAAAAGDAVAASALDADSEPEVVERSLELNNVAAPQVPEPIKAAQSIKSLVISLHDFKDEAAASVVSSASVSTVTESKLSLPATVRETMITEAEVDEFKAYWLANENEYRFGNLIFALNAIQRYQAWITLAPTVLPPPDVAVVHQIHKTVRTFEGDLPESLLGASFLNVKTSEEVISMWEHETGMPWLLEVSNTYYCTKCHGTITIRSTTEKCLVCREPLLASEYAVQIFRQASQYVDTIRKLRQVSTAAVLKSYALWLDQATIMTQEDGSQYLISAQSNSDEALVGHLIHVQAALRWRIAVWALFGRSITFFSPILTKQAQSNSRPVSIAAADLPTPVMSPMPISRPVTPRISLSLSRPGTPISSRPSTPGEQSRDLSLDPVALAYGRIIVDQHEASATDAYSKADKFFVPEDAVATEVTAEMVDRHWRMLRMLLQIETSHYAALILRSESRYLKWLTMVAETKRTDLVAPVDVALIAHVHAQFPDVLYSDLVTLFGAQSADLIMQHSILAEDVTRYQQDIDPLSESAWEQFTGEPYLYHHAKAGTTYLVSCPRCSTIQTIAHDSLVSLKSEAGATLVCSACTEANDLASLAKVNRGLAPFGLNFITQVTVWRSRMHKFLNESAKLDAQSTSYQYQQYARLAVELDNGSGASEMYSLTELTPAVQFGHATNLVFSGAYRRTMLRRFGHATTILRVEEPLVAIPVAMSKRESLLGISPSSSPRALATTAADAVAAVPMPPVPTEDETVTDAAERQRSRTLSLGAASAMTVEPAPEFDMRPEVLVTFFHLCGALMASPDFTFADDKQAQLYWTRAEDRYLKYLMLLQHTIVEGHALPLPPLDVLMMWLVHIMDSHRYVEDLVRVFGDVKMLNFAFPLDKVEVFLSAYHGQSLSAANWQEFVPASHAESWVRFAEQPFALESEVLERTWTLACPFCSNNQELEADLYTEMRTGSRMLFCKDCEKWITLPIVSAWRMVEDFRKAERGQGHLGGTLLNFNKGKIDYKLAHSVHKLLFFTHEKSLTEILEARLNERDVVNPWKELDLAAILHDYVQAAVEKEYTGKSKELKRKADIITGKILSYYQNVMTPLSLDLIMGRAAWAKLHADIADHLGEGFAEAEAQVVIDRYVKFLGLLEERRKANLKDEERYKKLVPAIDILLAHRCHLLDPLVYKKYCEFKFGKIMDFTRFTCKDELTAEYREMATLWSQKYSTPFDLTFKKKKKKGIKKVFGMLFGSRK